MDAAQLCLIQAVLSLVECCPARSRVPRCPVPQQRPRAVRRLYLMLAEYVSEMKTFTIYRLAEEKRGIGGFGRTKYSGSSD